MYVTFTSSTVCAFSGLQFSSRPDQDPRRLENAIHPRRAARKLEQAAVETTRRPVLTLEEICSLKRFIRQWKSIKRCVTFSLGFAVILILTSSFQVFFIVLLQPPTQSPLTATTDPDSLITCDLMDGRDAFLNLARERHWEFSSLRRSKFSTQALLYELHQGGDRFVYTCNNCRSDIETRWHCTVCEVRKISIVLCRSGIKQNCLVVYYIFPR